VQRHVLYLGEINDSQRASWCQTIEAFDDGSGGQARQVGLFPEDRAGPRASGFHENVREVAELSAWLYP